MIHAEISLMPNSLDNGEMLHDEFQLNLTEKVNGNWLATLINKALREYSKAQDEAIAMRKSIEYLEVQGIDWENSSQ